MVQPNIFIRIKCLIKCFTIFLSSSLLLKINHTRDYLLLSLGFSSKELQETEVAAAFHASTAVYVTLFTTWRLFYIAYDTFKRKLAKEVGLIFVGRFFRRGRMCF